MKQCRHFLTFLLAIILIVGCFGGINTFASGKTEIVLETDGKNAAEFVVQLADGMQVGDVKLSVSDDQQTWSINCKVSIGIDGNIVTYLVHDLTTGYVRAQWMEGAELVSSAVKDYTPVDKTYTGFNIRGDACLQGYGTVWSSSGMAPDSTTTHAFLAADRQATGTTYGTSRNNYVVVNTLNMDEVTIMTNWVRSIINYANIRFYGITAYPENVTSNQSDWDWKEITDFQIEAEFGVSTDWEVLDFVLDTKDYAFIKYEWDFSDDNVWLSRMSGMKAVRGTERTMASYGKLAWTDELDDYSKTAAYSENKVYIETINNTDAFIRTEGDKYVRAFSEAGPYELVWSAKGTKGMVFDTTQSNGINPNPTEDWEGMPLIYTTTSGELNDDTVWTLATPELSIYRENVAANAEKPIASYYIGGDVRKNTNVQLYITYGEEVTYVKFAFIGATANTPIYSTHLYKVAAIEREIVTPPTDTPTSSTDTPTSSTDTQTSSATTVPTPTYNLLLHDDMENFDKMAGYAANMVYNDYNEEQPHFFSEYWNQHCISKFAGGETDSWIMYDITGASRVDVAALIAERALTDSLGIEPNHLIFEVSKDKQNWTKVTPDAKLREEAGKWTEAKYSVTDLPDGMKYMRITLYVPNGISSWLSRVYSVDIYALDENGPVTGEATAWPVAIMGCVGAVAILFMGLESRRKAVRQK